MATLELRDAAVLVGGRIVLDGVSLKAKPAEVLGVLGPNGGGKTTLLRAALGLIPLARGIAFIGGRPVSSLTETVRATLAAYLPQDRRVAWNLAAWRVAALGRPWETPDRARERALAALSEVGAEHLAERGILDMSGGERARVLLARLILTGAPLLIADEPAAGLDPDSQLQIMDLLRHRADEGATVVVSLHDLTLAARCCDRLAVISKGRLAALGAPADALGGDILPTVFGLDGGVVETPFGPVVATRRGFGAGRQA